MTDLSALARHQPLDTAELRLVPLGMEHLDGMLAMLADEESGRLTGTARQFSRAEVEKHLTETVAREDRADWAAIRVADGRFLGEVVLNKLDAGNGVMNLRISFFGTDVLGRGYGTQAINAVVEYGFSRVGLHRIELGVFDFNVRAQRAYEKAGFVREGVRRESDVIDGQRCADVVMGILASDPRPGATMP